MTYMDYMDLAVHCTKKAVKLNHSLWNTEMEIVILAKFWSLVALEVVQ